MIITVEWTRFRIYRSAWGFSKHGYTGMWSGSSLEPCSHQIWCGELSLHSSAPPSLYASWK